MNPYLKNLNKIEFVLTYACTGKCKHCSQGEHKAHAEFIDHVCSAEVVKKVCSQYSIGTVMTFGGEPLLHLGAVREIMIAAKEMNVPKRQLITNGYFTTDREKMREVAEMLHAVGVNNLLLSVDAFHQDTIPLSVVRTFAMELKRCGVPTMLQPAWLVSIEDENPYNLKTREILDSLSDIGFSVSDGNVVFPEGNAKKYLAEYFTDSAPDNPYIDDPCDVKCLSIEPGGDLLGENIYKTDVMEIIEKYEPQTTN